MCIIFVLKLPAIAKKMAKKTFIGILFCRTRYINETDSFRTSRIAETDNSRERFE